MNHEAGPGGEESVSGELGERVRSIVAAAEGMAAAIRGDAEEYALVRRREADAEFERRLRAASEEADALLAARIRQAEDVHAQLVAMVHALGETAQRLARELGQSPAQPQPLGAREPGEAGGEPPMIEQVRPLQPPLERAPRPPLRQVGPAHVLPDDADTRLDDARLVALQMAVAGRSREEVAAHLRQAYEVGDPEPILDHVFSEDFPPSSAG